MLFGHIAVVNEGDFVPALCDVTFTDGDKHEKASAQTVMDGWIFTGVKTGPTYLSKVSCSLEGHVKGVANYAASDLQFDVPGGGKIAYFGHVQIDLNYEAPKGPTASEVAVAAAASEGTRELARVLVQGAYTLQLATATARLTGTVLGASLFESIQENFGERGGNAGAEVHFHLKQAREAYESRYGRSAGGLNIHASLAGGGPPATTDPPTRAAGFELGERMELAAARCTDAALTWEKLDDGRFSCSGTPSDLGVPAKATLTACGGAVCEVALDASADGADWKMLVGRFASLTRTLVGVHGYDRKRSVAPLRDCTEEPRRCFEAGRARRSATWSWGLDSMAILVIDGGPQDGAPSLRLVYRTAAAMMGQP